MNNIFNSTCEIAMRILIILSIVDDGLDIDTLTCIDFISTYSKDFKINDINLHGDNNFNFSGFAARRTQIKKALTTLLAYNYIKVTDSASGIHYRIIDLENVPSQKLKSEYSRQYKEIVKMVLLKIKSKSSKQIYEELFSQINHSIKGGKL